MMTPEKKLTIKMMIAYLKSIGKEIPPEYKEIEKEMEEEKKKWLGGKTHLGLK